MHVLESEHLVVYLGWPVVQLLMVQASRDGIEVHTSLTAPPHTTHITASEPTGMISLSQSSCPGCTPLPPVFCTLEGAMPAPPSSQPPPGVACTTALLLLPFPARHELPVLMCFGLPVVPLSPQDWRCSSSSALHLVSRSAEAGGTIFSRSVCYSPSHRSSLADHSCCLVTGLAVL